MVPTSTVSYLDYNATTPVLPEVAAAVAASLADFGNPSSVHGFGRRARAMVEEAREAVAALVGAGPGQVIFTSGGTEANALAVQGIAAAAGCEAVLASSVEHSSVLAHVAAANCIAVDGTGAIDLEALERALKRQVAPVLVAVMLANNETGTVQPVADAAALAHKYGALMHCDAVQGPGKMAVNMVALGVDSLSLSAHKLGGLKGCGALVVREGLALAPQLTGGGQERRRRAGTENVPGIVGFGAAARQEPRQRAAMARIGALRDDLEARLMVDVRQARIFSRGAARLGNTVCVALPGVSSETQVMRLDLAGVAVSAGSACSSGKIAASHVLLAMGVNPALAKCAIRISLGWDTTAADIARFLACWEPLATNAAA